MQFDAASIFLGGTVLRPCESNLVELGNSTERIPEAYYCFPLLEGYETEPFSRDDYDQFPSDLVIAETFFERFVDVITVLIVMLFWSPLFMHGLHLSQLLMILMLRLL